MQTNSQDIEWMRCALELARKAALMGEVPVGALLVKDNELVAEGWNQPIQQCDPTAHAEIIVLRKAAKQMNNYRLPNTTLYTTLEPCAMCAGAIIHARVQRLVFGAYDNRAGAAGSVLNLFDTPELNHRVVYEGGILTLESVKLLQTFFRARR